MPAKGRRKRIWELSSTFHCSVVGTCLTTAELRGLFTKLKEPRAKTASDHELHSLAVHAAGRDDLAGKLLNKMLEKRHEAHLRRFAKAQSVDELRTQWSECLEKGDIPGAYWAVLTHPLIDPTLTREVFGEVHMLSHLVGTSNRADIARLRLLERALEDREEKIRRQEARLKTMAEERAALQRQAEQQALDLARALSLASTAAPEPAHVERLRRKLADEQARAGALAERLSACEADLAESGAREAELSRLAAALKEEVRSLEESVAPAAAELEAISPRLAGRHVLYVGGLHRHVDALAALARRYGATLLFHDGGVEESPTLLPGLVSQADFAVVPVDCVSHLAAGQVKRLCREGGKRFSPLRTASLASFAAALAQLSADGAAAGD